MTVAICHRLPFERLTSHYRTLIVGFNATSITSASLVINGSFGVSDDYFPNSFWPVTSWAVGAALAPMVVLPIIEDFGTRTGYLVDYNQLEGKL